ncbi:hypothetical protein [Succinimonas sp.]|jgi:hypothetical protein|uniref:hypothetical protein n=1 Tax=Succinimonas sp. TaxID=1936151 RepID=UPI00386E364D
MKIIIKAPLWTKIFHFIGVLMLVAGIGCHFFGIPDIPDEWMAFFLIGGVILITPYNFVYLKETLKLRPKS